MTLLLCRACNDVVKFGPPMEWRPCLCGRSSARYLADGYHAEMAGEHAVALGIDNHSVRPALAAAAKPPATAVHPRLDAWVFPDAYYRIAHLATRADSREPRRRRLAPAFSNLEDVCDAPLPPSPS